MMMRSGAERMAVNMPCQGTVADLMKLAMVRVIDGLPKAATMLLQIHDELLFEVDKDAVEATERHIREVMTNIAELKVPLVVDINHGTNWAELKG
jgi:DNA polymerase-1